MKFAIVREWSLVVAHVELLHCTDLLDAPHDGYLDTSLPSL